MWERRFLRMKRIILIVICFCLPSMANLYPSMFSIMDTSMIVHKQKQMSTIFQKISWNEPGLYLFLEKSYLQLFYFNHSQKMEYYQYPLQKKSKWLEPEAYLEERKQIESNDWTQKCHAEIEVTDSLLKNLYGLHIEQFPYIVDEEMEVSFRYGKDETVMFWGVLIDESGKHYFKFRRLKGDEKTLKMPYSLFLPVYHMLDQYPFNVKLDSCK